MSLNKQTNLSPNMREQQKVKDSAVLLKKVGTLHRFALAEKLGMTAQQMNIFHPKLEFFLQDIASYDKPTKTWNLIPEEEENPLD